MTFSMFDWPINLLVAALFYLIGSIPSGYLVARIAGVSDIRQHGSGNIGATNVGRTLGPLYFFLVLFLDFIKAYLALYCVSSIGFPAHARCGAVFLLLGNAYSLFLRGRGGKGVATSAGILAWCFPDLFYFFSALWIGTTLATQTPWIASVFSMLCLPLYLYFVCTNSWWLLLMVFVVVLRHRSNIIKYYYNV